MITHLSRRLVSYALFLLGALFFSGCAKAPSELPEGALPAPGGVWERFQDNSRMAEANAGPFRVNATLSYRNKDGSQRVTVYFWGNGAAQNPYPLRLDILAGPGNVASKVREDANTFLAYVPNENAAYTHVGGELNLLAFGVPLPFSLADFSLLLTGQYSLFFVDSVPGRAFPVPPVAKAASNSLSFRLYDVRLPGTLELNAEGLPLSWSAQGGKGWRMDIEYWDESTRITPRKIRLSHPKGMEALVLVRELSRPDAFTPSQLDLPLPPGTERKPLRKQQEPS